MTKGPNPTARRAPSMHEEMRSLRRQSRQYSDQLQPDVVPDRLPDVRGPLEHKGFATTLEYYAAIDGFVVLERWRTFLVSQKSQQAAASSTEEGKQ